MSKKESNIDFKTCYGTFWRDTEGNPRSEPTDVFSHEADAKGYLGKKYDLDYAVQPVRCMLVTEPNGFSRCFINAVEVDLDRTNATSKENLAKQAMAKLSEEEQKALRDHWKGKKDE